MFGQAQSRFEVEASQAESRATRPQAKKDFRYQVQWVGYCHSESTWEYESKLAQIAPEELIKFEAKNESAPEAPARKPKRGIGRSSGHARKKFRVN
ncbi:hypothetical protein F5883DRAFT_656231 [Diaporthe sp. PMI_573]|nr:hypothetical protein F5883DRAFT_656231 [Diaporthaceae sp. PMI_573]